MEDPEHGWKQWRNEAKLIGVDYVPTRFDLDETGFTTRWGRCEYNHSGRTLLIFGDSTTRQTAIGPTIPAQEEDRSTYDHNKVNWTWPDILKRRHLLPADVQICVISEVGYHPIDYRAFLHAIGPKLRPTVVTLLLCPNDLEAKTRLVPLHLGAAFDGYQGPTYMMAWKPAYFDLLFHHSVFFRYLHFRMARARPHESMNVTVPIGQERWPGLAFADLDADPSALVVFLLPYLEDGYPFPAGLVERLELVSGVTIHRVDFPYPLTALRQTTGDRVHMNADGHWVVAGQAAPVILKALGEGR